MLWLKDNGDEWRIVLSNDKAFVPDWDITTPPVPDDPTPEVAPLYITGADDFANGEWNPGNPDEFDLFEGNYTYLVNNLTEFKISTTKGNGEDSDVDWIEFNRGVYGCPEYILQDRDLRLEYGWDANIRVPVKGKYIITVSADLSYI